MPPLRSIAAAPLLLLAACGGGGGAASTGPPGTTPDTTPPTLAIVAPSDASVLASPDVDLEVSYDDPNLDLASLVVLLDGSSVAGGLTADASGAIGTLAGLGEGVHQIEVTIADTAGNTATLTVEFEIVLLAQPQEYLVRIHPGDATFDVFGIAVGAAGDVDGDGLADVVVGAIGNDGGAPNGGLARVLSGADGALLFDLLGAQLGESLGGAVTGIGDVNDDGRSDLAVGSPGRSATAFNQGAVSVYSGDGGAFLFEELGEHSDDAFGSRIAAVGDVDLDGIPDLLASAFESDFPVLGSGRARILSGADGSELLLLEGEALGLQFGISVDAAGDVNVDGVPDVLVGVWGDDTNGPSAGAARIYSGEDGALLREVFGLDGDDHMGNSVATVGDVDGDSVPDFLVGAWEADPNGENSGEARLYSGATGTELAHFPGDAAGEQWGAAVARADDVDGDGVGDLAISGFAAEDADGNSGVVRIYSGATYELLRTLGGGEGNTQFGLVLAQLGDATGDGLGDLLVGAPWEDSVGPLSGAARVYSGAPLDLLASSNELSLAAGGSLDLVVDAGPAQAGAPFRLLASSATTSAPPTTTVDGLPVPLEPDAYYQATLVGEQPGATLGLPLEYSALAGTLDANGRAIVRLRLDPGAPAALAGTVLRHAVVHGSPSKHVTNPVHVRLRP